MRIQIADLRKLHSRKRGAAGEAPQPTGGAPRPRGAVAKRPRPTVAVPAPSRSAGEEEDEVQVVQGPPVAAPAQRPPSPPRQPSPSPHMPPPVPQTESTRLAAERRKRGKGSAGASSSAARENEEDEEDMHHVCFKVPLSASAIGSRTLARDVLKSVVLPKDDGDLRGRPLEDNIRSMYASIARFITSVSIVEDGVHGFAELAKKIGDQAETAKADAEVAKELQKAGELRESKLQEELRNVQEAGEKRELDLKELREQLTMEKEANRTLREDLAAADLRTKKAEEEREAESSRARAAEETKAEAVAEARTKAAEEALAEFRLSEEYRMDVTENCFESFHLGFEECKGKTARAFPDLDLSAIKAFEGQEEAEAGGEAGGAEMEAAAEVGVGEVAPTTEVVVVMPAATDGAGSESALIDSQEGA